MSGKRLVVFADYVCPFCHLAELGVARFRRSSGWLVHGAAFELRPAGTPLADLNAEWMRAAWSRTVEPLAQEAGVIMRYPAVATRTRKAHEAAAHARSQGRYEAMHEAIYAAYWEHGRDIGRIDVLVDIGRAVGLDATALKVALDIDQWSERVEQDEAWAAQLRLGGVPAYVMLPAGEQAGMTIAADIRVGLQGYDELRAWTGQDHDV